MLVLCSVVTQDGQELSQEVLYTPGTSNWNRVEEYRQSIGHQEFRTRTVGIIVEVVKTP